MRKNQLTLFLLVADLVAMVLAFWAAYWLRYESDVFLREPHPAPLSSMFYGPLLAMGLWILFLLLFESHEFPSGLSYPLGFSRLATPCFLFVVAFLACSFLGRAYYSRLLLMLFFIIFSLFLLVVRFCSAALLAWLRRYGIGLRRVAIVGDSELAQELAHRIRQHPELHYEVTGFLTPAAGRVPPQRASSIVGNSDFVSSELGRRGVDELIFVIPIRKDSETLDFIAGCQRQGITIKLVPEYYEMHAQQIETLSIDGIPLLEIKEPAPEAGFRILKRSLDLTIAGSLLILFSPAMLLISVLLRLSGNGQCVKSETRVGLSGRLFQMYRFATDMEKGGGDGWDVRLRRFLHRYSLSELPQFWNVLKGDMSLVGPRPESLERVRHYSPWHERRLQLKPGMTGLAQVRGLRGTDSSDEKTRYDLEYAASLSPFLDVSLIFATVGTVVRRRKVAPKASSPPPVLRSGRKLDEKRV